MLRVLLLNFLWKNFNLEKAKSFICQNCSEQQVQIIGQYSDVNYTDARFEDFLNETKGNFDGATDFLKKSENYLLGEVTGIADKSTVIHEAGHLLVLQGKVKQR